MSRTGTDNDKPESASPISSAAALGQILTETVPDGVLRQDKLKKIGEKILNESNYMDAENFTVFHPQDLERMVQEYDQQFLGGACYTALEGRPLKFRLAPRLTRAGGLTTWKKRQSRRTGRIWEEFEISISSHLLFQTFRDEDREVKVVGLACGSRLEAMQRIVEHELIHLCEKLAWNESSCKRQRFQAIAARLFGHLQHTHELVTTAEVARTVHGIRPGCKAAFEIEGRSLQGIVNKITKRATVLVPDPDGRPYSDGCRYTRYYVPLGLLTVLAPPQ